MSSTATIPVQMAAAVWRRILAAPDRLENWLSLEQDRLALWVPVALAAGIAGYFVLPWNEQRLGFLTATVALIILGLGWRGWAGRVIWVGGLLALLGFGLAWGRAQDVAAPRLAHAGNYGVVGVVENVEFRGQGALRLGIAPFDPALPPQLQIVTRSGALSASAIAALAPGARVSLYAWLAPPEAAAYPGGYDFARIAWFSGIGATGVALGEVGLLAPPEAPSGIALRLASIRSRLTQHLLRAVPGQGGLTAAFVTGERGGIDPWVTMAMRNAGLAHLLSISGLHIAVVVSGTMWGVRHLLLLWPWLALRIPVKAMAAGFGAATGLGYTLIAGYGVPTIRTLLATLIILLGIMVGRAALTLRLVSASALAILLVRPEALLSPSFQLSFAAVTGLVALYQSRLGRWLGRRDEFDGWTVRLGRALLALLVTGLVAEAMLSPIALFHFNQTGVYGVIANMVAIPFTSLAIMPALVLALLLDVVGCAAPAYWLVGQCFDLLVGWAGWIANWPGAVVRLPTISAWAFGLLVGGGLWLCLWRTSARWFGFGPIFAGVVAALLTSAPDLLVSADGREVGLKPVGGRLLHLRAGRGSYVRDSWDSASGLAANINGLAAIRNGLAANINGYDIDAIISPPARRIADMPGSDCRDGWCSVDTVSPGGERLLIGIIPTRITPSEEVLRHLCRSADILISSQPLPMWCRPHWLRLDPAQLQSSGALAIWFSPRQIAAAKTAIGDHPWRPVHPNR